MARVAWILLAATLWPLCAASPARADDVDVALVLVTDVSRSIDDSEFKLEKDGYASAFVNQKVLEAIQGGPTGQIAVAYVEFASSFEVRTVLDWTVIRDEGRRRPSSTALPPRHARSGDAHRSALAWIRRCSC